ncbi:hypothetical protein AB0K61_19115, partial [Streptomyces syringium]
MSSPTGPVSGLPVRMPRPRQPGRHRRPEPAAAPAGAPPLVLAVPGTPDRPDATVLTLESGTDGVL